MPPCRWCLLEELRGGVRGSLEELVAGSRLACYAVTITQRQGMDQGLVMLSVTVEDRSVCVCVAACAPQASA